MKKHSSYRKYLTLLPYVFALFLLWPAIIHAGDVTCPTYSYQQIVAKAKAADTGYCEYTEWPHNGTRTFLRIFTDNFSSPQPQWIYSAERQIYPGPNKSYFQLGMVRNPPGYESVKFYSCASSDEECMEVAAACFDALRDAVLTLADDPDIDFDDSQCVN
mgnify:CR=1 FL=1